MTIFSDARFALRTLARNPGFAAVAILTLGLGIGMSVAVWSVVDAVLIEPLPYPDADRLVEMGMTETGRHAAGYPMSALDYRDYSERNQTFETMAATFRENLNLTGGASPERVSGAWVSAPFFAVMGIEPQLGRPFSTEEDVPGQDLVAVISHGLWQRHFGGDPDVLGQSVIVNGRPYVVVGVAPRDFAFPRDTELWLPIAIDWQNEDRGHGWVVPYGRIRQDLGLDEARTDLERIASQLRDEQPETSADRGVAIVPVKETIVGEIRPAVSVLLAAVAGVLLIAAANVSILLLFRSILRQHEIAIRQSLGARRGQLVRLLMVESTLLALAGGIVGLAFAHWSTGLLRVRFAELIPRSEGVGLDLTVFGFALALSVTIGLLVGALPALRAREIGIMTRLRENDRAIASRGPVVSGVLVVAEIALAVVLLVGAALLMRSFVNLVNVQPGFDSRGVLTAEVSLTAERYAEEADRIEFLRRAVEGISSYPEVEVAGTVYPLPLHGRRVTTSAYVEGAPGPAHDSSRPLVELRFVSPGYFQAIGLRLVTGRFIQEADTADAQQVVVVNETFVRELVPHGGPVGRRTTGYDPDDPEAEWQTIVGVVENVRHIDLADEPGPEMYIPVAQSGFEWATLVVRARSGNAMALADPIRTTIQRLDPELPVFNVQTLEDVVANSLGQTRFVTTILVLFSASALLLAGVGVFSVVSYSIGRRVRELAIRMAFGATKESILALVVRQALVPAAIGVALGLATALAASRLLSNQLYGVVAHDLPTYVAAAFLILAMAALSTWLPAWRATRVDPNSVLHSE